MTDSPDDPSNIRPGSILILLPPTYLELSSSSLASVNCSSMPSASPTPASSPSSANRVAFMIKAVRCAEKSEIRAETAGNVSIVLMKDWWVLRSGNLLSRPRSAHLVAVFRYLVRSASLAVTAGFANPAKLVVRRRNNRADRLGEPLSRAWRKRSAKFLTMRREIACNTSKRRAKTYLRQSSFRQISARSILPDFVENLCQSRQRFQ